jgi:hypothetical protein
MGKTLNGFLKRVYRKTWLFFPEFALCLFVDCSKFDCARTYNTLLEQILSVHHLSIRTIRDLQKPFNSEGIIIGFRHDIDYDIVTARQLAKIEHEFGLKGSYYVLHTAPYYGYFKNRKYYRSKRCIDILLEIQSMGHEIGLHNDCLYPLIKHGIPIEETLQSELTFLQSNGIHVYGTASHGSFHSYGSSNYEIFKGMSIEGRQRFIDKNGQEHRIGYLNMKDFNLEYEANYILKSWIISADEYNRISFPYKCPYERSDFFIRGYDAQYGIFGKNLWFAQDIKKVKATGTLLPIFSLTTGELIHRVKAHGPGDRIVLDSHPIYFGHSRRRIMMKYMFDHLTPILKKLFRFKGLE